MVAEKQTGVFDLTGLPGLHDMQLDYYGKRAAAAFADNSVQIWSIADGKQQPAGTLRGHEGPVWKVAWAHPQFGSLLATCGYDMKVIVWKEMPANSGQWQIAFMDTTHTASVNDIQFCPWEYGLRLACASSDGTVSILSHGADQQWRRVAFPAHAGGAQALSWMPAQVRDGAVQAMRLVTGGCDNAVSVWKSDTGDNWVPETPPMPSPAHGDWVRAVACCPSSEKAFVATGSWDKSVLVWAQEREHQPWRQVCKLTFDGKVEGLSWSVTGSILAVAYGEGEMSLYKETVDGRFEPVGKMDESGFEEIPHSSQENASTVAQPFLAPPAVGAAPPAPPANNEFAAQQQSVLDAFAC